MAYRLVRRYLVNGSAGAALKYKLRSRSVWPWELRQWTTPSNKFPFLLQAAGSAASGARVYLPICGRKPWLCVATSRWRCQDHLFSIHPCCEWHKQRNACITLFLFFVGWSNIGSSFTVRATKISWRYSDRGNWMVNKVGNDCKFILTRGFFTVSGWSSNESTVANSS